MYICKAYSMFCFHFAHKSGGGRETSWIFMAKIFRIDFCVTANMEYILFPCKNLQYAHEMYCTVRNNRGNLALFFSLCYVKFKCISMKQCFTFCLFISVFIKKILTLCAFHSIGLCQKYRFCRGCHSFWYVFQQS